MDQNKEQSEKHQVHYSITQSFVVIFVKIPYKPIIGDRPQASFDANYIQ